MGCYKENYVIVGTNILKHVKDLKDEAFEDLIDLINKEPKIKAIFDGMSGEYLMVGLVLSHTREDDELEFLSVSHSKLKADCEFVKSEILRIVGIETLPELIVFQHSR